MKINSFREFFVILLSEIYEMENYIVAALPKMIQKAYSDDLKEALRTHLEETKIQVKRLEKVFKIMKEEPCQVDWSRSFDQILINSEKHLSENESSPLLDAELIVMAQRVEHYEIATYGALIEFADILELDDVKKILKDTIKEESHADTLLNKIAKGGLFSSGVNAEATKE